jgi:hypothetical protein
MGSEYVSTGLFWFTLSLLNAGLAQSKQRPGFRWWLISLLIGPFATPLLVAWPPGDHTGSPGDFAGPPPHWEVTWTHIGYAVLALVLAALGIIAYTNFTN